MKDRTVSSVNDFYRNDNKSNQFERKKNLLNHAFCYHEKKETKAERLWNDRNVSFFSGSTKSLWNL